MRRLGAKAERRGRGAYTTQGAPRPLREGGGAGLWGGAAGRGLAVSRWAAALRAGAGGAWGPRTRWRRARHLQSASVGCRGVGCRRRAAAAMSAGECGDGASWRRTRAGGSLGLHLQHRGKSPGGSAQLLLQGLGVPRARRAASRPSAGARAALQHGLGEDALGRLEGATPLRPSGVWGLWLP